MIFFFSLPLPPNNGGQLYFDFFHHPEEEKICGLVGVFPVGSPSRGGYVTVYVFEMTNRDCPLFFFCTCVCFRLYGPLNCISFHKFSRQLSAFSLCSSGFISALLGLSTIYLFMKFSLSPDFFFLKCMVDWA